MGKIGTEFNEESAARDTLCTVFARQTRARAVHMDRTCGRRCAHVRGTRRDARSRCSVHSHESPSTARGKDPERIHNANMLHLPFGFRRGGTLYVVCYWICLKLFEFERRRTFRRCLQITRNVLRRFPTRSSNNILHLKIHATRGIIARIVHECKEIYFVFIFIRLCQLCRLNINLSKCDARLFSKFRLTTCRRYVRIVTGKFSRKI